MRGSALILVSVLAVTLAGCSRRERPPAPPTPPAPAAPGSPPTPAAPAPPESPPAAATPEAPSAPTPPQPPETVRFSPSDYGAKERRIAALINNAQSRDASGETDYVAQQGREQRQRCATRACVEKSYAAEEAKLRRWEGSSDVR